MLALSAYSFNKYTFFLHKIIYNWCLKFTNMLDVSRCYLTCNSFSSCKNEVSALVPSVIIKYSVSISDITWNHYMWNNYDLNEEFIMKQINGEKEIERGHRAILCPNVVLWAHESGTTENKRGRDTPKSPYHAWLTLPTICPRPSLGWMFNFLMDSWVRYLTSLCLEIKNALSQKVRITVRIKKDNAFKLPTIVSGALYVNRKWKFLPHPLT